MPVKNPFTISNFSPVRVIMEMSWNCDYTLRWWAEQISKQVKKARRHTRPAPFISTSVSGHLCDVLKRKYIFYLPYWIHADVIKIFLVPHTHLAWYHLASYQWKKKISNDWSNYASVLQGRIFMLTTRLVIREQRSIWILDVEMFLKKRQKASPDLFWSQRLQFGIY